MEIAGGTLLLIAFSSTYLRRLPVSTSVLYLLLGLSLGPVGAGWLELDLASDSPWFEYLAQVAVIVSLFIGGLKLRLPFSAAAWRSVPRLVGPIMLLTIFVLAAFAHYVLHLPAPIAILLGAVLAPTDPVLASAASVSEAADHDRMRYGLSGEAGLNDGMAFPFVVFALSWLEEQGPGLWIGRWMVIRVLWAVPAALGLGFVMGRYVGRLAAQLRASQRDVEGPNDLLALALIALSYSAAEQLHAWGFLSVFAAGVGLRHAERMIVVASPHPEAPPELDDARTQHPPAEDMVAAKVATDSVEQPAVAVGMVVSEALAFGRTAERLLELTMVVLVGAALAVHWDARAITLSLFLFMLLRPLATYLSLLRTPTTPAQRLLMGWFGIRGVGSLYYVAYAFTHAREPLSIQPVADLTLSVVALSVFAHGVTVQPLVALYERTLRRRRDRTSDGFDEKQTEPRTPPQSSEDAGTAIALPRQERTPPAHGKL